MIIEDSTLHILNALLTPGVLGGLGLRWIIQRRNGNGNAKRSDVHDSEKRINKRIDEKFDDINRQILNARGWIDDVEKEQRIIRNLQTELVSRVAKCEGVMSRGKV